MKFKSNLIIAAVLSAVICTPIISSARSDISLPTGQIEGYNKYTPTDNIFKTQKSPNREFVLLDSDKDGYLVMANEIYLLREFDSDGTQKFDVADENNIAYFLNNEFLESGEYLPEEIKKYIDKNRSWQTESGSKNGNCPKEYSTKCGVSLLSYTEFMKYYPKFGLQYDSLKKDWYLRSPLSTDASDTVISAGGTFASEGKLVAVSSASMLGVRPVFWLQKDFFKEVRLNITAVGGNVSAAVRKNIRLDSMRKCAVGYSDYELKRLGYGIKTQPSEYITVNIPNSPTYIQNTADAYADVTVNISGKETKEYVVEYSPDGTFDDARKFTLTAVPYQNNILRLDLSGEKKGKYPYFAIRVSGSDGVAAVSGAPITIFDFYTGQSLDEYSKIGMNFASDTKTTRQNFTENYNYLLSKIGITKMRGNHRWSWNENPIGNRNYSRHSYWDIVMEKYNQSYTPYILGYGNTLYYPADPRTYQNVKDTMGYNIEIIDFLQQLGVDVNSLEIWNEPNLPTFWGGTNHTITYSQMANRMAYEMKKLYPEKDIIGCAVASQNGEKFIDAFFRRGGLMYVDGFSCHPYTYPNDPDIRHLKRASDFVDRREEAGGWLTVSQTEVGYPTQNAQGGVDDVTQSKYIPKLYIYNDELDIDLTNLYVLDDIGWNDTYSEHNFGIMQMDYVPKEAAVSVAQLVKYCANAQYIGRFAINENSFAYVYTKLNKTFTIVWSTADDYEYTLEDGTAAEDLNGNEIENDGTITVGNTPVYLSDISDSYALSATAYQVHEAFEELRQMFGEKFDLSGFSTLETALTLDKRPSDSELKDKINGVYAFGAELIDQYSESKAELKDLSLILFKLHQSAKKIAAYYASYDAANPDSDEIFDETNKMIADAKGSEPDSALLYTDAIMRFANRYNKKANEIAANYKDETGIAGEKAECDLLCTNLCLWAQKMLALEEPDTSKAVFAYLSDTEPTVYQGQAFEFSVEVENLRRGDINGQIIWRDENLNALGSEYECTVKSGECKSVNYGGAIPSDYPLGTKIFYADITENGKLLKRLEMQTTVKGIADVALKEADKPLSELTNISVECTSTFNRKMSGTLEVEAPDGWILEYDKADFTLNPNETKVFNIKISKFKRMPYNDYCFKFTLYDDKGSVLMKKDIPLDFLVTVKADSEIDISGFDGDITGWENAYPIHINTPDNAADINSWKNANIAAKALTKWDENYFYALVDVYDDMYLQSYAGSNIWMGDSIQLAFDTLNDKASSFVGDDYEYGFSHSAAGLEIQGFLVASGKTTGSKDPEWVRIVRDGENHITRYLIKLPKAELTPMKLQQGTEFGFNVCANDADILERDSYIQFTGGIADKKNPSAFMTFTLKGTESGAEIDGETCGFITKINSTGFSDFDK